MNTDIIGCILISLGLWYWFSAKGLQESAYAAVRHRCQRLQLQMLDDYVALQSIRINRSPQGRLQLVHTYGFEFSSTGNERYQGQIILLGRQVQTIQLEAYRMPEPDYS